MCVCVCLATSLDPGEKGGGRRAWKREEVAGAGEGDFWSNRGSLQPGWQDGSLNSGLCQVSCKPAGLPLLTWDVLHARGHEESSCTGSQISQTSLSSCVAYPLQ